ncbi:YdeI/OmpD-associated family protein [Zeaxanthinibacter enoshimensis]|uniref:Uncharacterized protein YdeI (YjbR/CyaY-like superfamily) n=1 Tax=Zeaxanthinibacter enoshimensis TaxID=392009 RepID=A0A4R6TP42_9FLAO|nr:YdeI/OmpD-associated family protein [Zeaxanthinibacter enoshimensis]TDQ33055.1 uncharacterized protein YdeI (YjbR/CyaY-like superfamily) [Zeaxanthinibacter enoshimensis]
MNPKVNFFFDKDSPWQEEYRELRKLALDCGLEEELKWGKPCYTYNDKNIVLIHGFKEYCALLFHKGVLLENKHDLLVQQTENVQSARQLRFSDVNDIKGQRAVIRSYLFEAIEVEKAGLQVAYKETKQYDMPDEFRKKLDKDIELKKAFEALTPGRQRGYLLYFSEAKQSKTRESRINKCRSRIMQGLGRNDK